jgi:hypothetical protein
VVFRQRESMSMTFARAGNEIIYPRVWFNAFHPDVVYVTEFGPVLPPLGTDNSSLVLYAWHRKMSAADTARLFTEPVFERLSFFDRWSASKRVLLEEGEIVGFPLDDIFARIERHGCFMRTPAHPSLVVAAEIARELARRAGLPVLLSTPESYIDDPMLHMAIWPVYPEIAQRLGLPGAYAFRLAEPPTASPTLVDLDEFIERSFDAFAETPPAALACARLENPAYRDLESLAAGERKRSRNGKRADPAPVQARPREGSPYADLPAERFWRRAIERVPPCDVDPVGTPPFGIDRHVRIATAGSCFAQNMSHALVRRGYNYFVAEPAPEHMSAHEARQAGFGVFSTRCGNVYTARQLLQLFDRAYGTLAPNDAAWARADGRYVDPFRPQIEPNGYATVDEVIASRDRHLQAVRTMFERLDVLIFTLGLTEAWRAIADGAVFPLAPGVTAGRMDATRYQFVNFTAAEVRDDLDAFLERLSAVNPRARVVLTVSPQPPIATYEPRHVLVSATYTKAALRVAADEIARARPGVWYFPGYELVASAFNRGAYYERDLRTVTAEGVEHVMRLFLAHCAADGARPPAGAEALMLEENRANADVVCDEEEIALAGAGVPQAANGLTASARDWSDDGDFRAFHHLLDSVEANGAPPATVMEALDPAAMRGPLQASLPAAMRAGTIATVACSVTNLAGIALASMGKHPIYVCYRWFDAAGNPAEVGRALHTALPAVLQPGATVTLAMRIAAPQFEGRYRLRAALLQSEVAWFDDVDPRNGVEAAVEVSAKTVAFASASNDAPR